jgi:hypothetical protein
MKKIALSFFTTYCDGALFYKLVAARITADLRVGGSRGEEGEERRQQQSIVVRGENLGW